MTSASCSISQYAALEAMNTDPEKSTEVRNMVFTFRKRRNLIMEYLDKIPGMRSNIPEGAFYVFPNVSGYFGKKNGSKTIENAKDLCMYLLEEAHVAIVPGEAFGNPNCVRISYATSRELLEVAMKRIIEALARLS
jgi:aspartate aminotransferase